MRAVVLTGPGQILVEDVPDPMPGPDEVVIAVRECGICGTDLHLVSGGLGAALPVVPGHEPWGEVVATGSQVSRFEPADLVAVDPSLHCGKCDRCRRGQGNMCDNWGSLGATKPGAWAQFVAVPSASVYPLGESFPLGAAALLEPVACAVRGLELLTPRPDQPAIVFGAGTMGILLAILLELRGVGPVTIVDVNPERRRLAAPLTGATVLDIEEAADLRAPWVIEATGNPKAFTQALECVDRAGHFLVFGVADPQELASISPYRVYADELTIMGSKAILRSFPAAVETVARHATRLAPLVTHRFSIDQIGTALDTVSAGQSVKTVITPGLMR